MDKNLDLPLILELFPDCPRVQRPPSIDEVVCEYLRKHEVNITPISSDLQPSRLTNAAMGAMGAGYLAANTHLTVQERSAKLQEWTSWKQWALSQPVFQDFKKNLLEQSNTSQQRQDEWLLKNQAKIQVATAEQRLKEKQDQLFQLRIFAIIVGGLFALGGVIAIHDLINKPSSPPTSTQQK